MNSAGTSLAPNTLIRASAILAGLSLFAAALVLFVGAWDLPSPILQMPVVLLTLLLGGVILYGGSLAAAGRRREALLTFGTSLLLVLASSLAHFVPWVYEKAYLNDWESIFPPVWPYAVAIPLLLFLCLELAVPPARAASPPAPFLLFSTAAALLMVFFGISMVGIVHSSFTLVVTSYRLLISFLACIGLGSVIVLGAVLAYKGRALASIALLYFAGLSIEWLSVQYWQGPFWLVGPLMDVYPWFPLLPIIAGTLPGVLAALAALAQAWELFARSATPPLQELTGQRGGQK